MKKRKPRGDSIDRALERERSKAKRDELQRLKDERLRSPYIPNAFHREDPEVAQRKRTRD